jgi:hypothetical protein
LTGITVKPSATSAEVHWLAVAGATAYSVTDGVGETCTAAAGPPLALTCTLKFLTPDIQYTATVTATFPGGTSSGVSDTFEVGKPDKPTHVTADMNTDGSITANWSAPANVHAGIHHYKATADDGSGGGDFCVTTDETTTTCDIAPTNLDPSTDYTVTVVAVGVFNGFEGTGTNDSDASVASNTVSTPIGAPDTVTTSALTGTSRTVTWIDPVPDDGVDHYTATASPGGATCSTDDGDPTATTCDITGLTPGVVYTVSVVSIGTQAGVTSAASSPSIPFVLGDLNAPTGVTATAGNGEAMVSWTAPAGAAAADLGYYTVTSSGGDVCNTIDAATTSCTVTGLDNLTSYTFTVVAHSSALGTHPDSAPSAASAAVVPMPASVTLKAGANGKYVTAENAGAWWLIANRASAGAWEQFDLVSNSDGTISLRAGINGKYVTAEAGGAAPLIANRSSAGSWEKFWLLDNGDGTFSLKSVANGKFVTAEAGGARALVANRSSIGGWEKFTIS